MNLDETITFTFTTREVCDLELFFDHGMRKLGQGVFRDRIEAIQRRMKERILRSKYDGSENNNKPF